jgi:hypothetical protein
MTAGPSGSGETFGGPPHEAGRAGGDLGPPSFVRAHPAPAAEPARKVGHRGPLPARRGAMSPSSLRPAAWLAASTALVTAVAACDPFGHPPEVGGELGTYHVEATATENDCGEGALGMTKEWAFDVELSRTEHELHWDNVAGPLEEDGRTFTFSYAFDQDMRTESDPKWLPACSIRRTDTAEGVLSSDGEDVEGFTGKLSYAFAPTEGSDCSDLAGAQGPVFLRLPCNVRYGLDAVRTRAPGEDDAAGE